MITRARRLLIVAGVAALAAGPAAAQEKLKVLATFSILGDFARKVGGDRVEVSSLVGPNSDAHFYTPAPADVRRAAEARVVITNGLGFEGWMSRLIRASGGKATVVVASKGIEVRKAAGNQGHGHADDAADPHAWQSVANAKSYVVNIRDALAAADPDGAAAYRANATTYLARLDDLDKEIRAAIAAIPADRRRMITNHDAFGYFQQAYGVEFIAPQGVSTEAESSARDVARIITQVKKQRIPAIFLENITDPRLMERIAKETGARVGGKLYSDALTEEHGDAPSYIDLMRHNLKTISAALMR